jgi:hypothetical protein
LLAIPLLGLPWTAFIGDGIVQLIRRLRGATFLPADPSTDRSRLVLSFALAWLLFPLLFFSFSNSKLPGYILPVMPGIALIVGERLKRLSSESNNNWAIKTTAFLSLLVASGVLGYAWNAGNVSVKCAFLIAAPLIVAGAFALLSRRQSSGSIILIAAAIVPVMIIALRCVAPQVADRESSKRLLQLADARGYSRTVVYGMQRSDRTPEFYAAGRVVYGTDGEPIMYEGPFQVIATSQIAGVSVTGLPGIDHSAFLVFVPTRDVSRITGMAPAQTEVIGSNGRYALIAVNYQTRAATDSR